MVDLEVRALAAHRELRHGEAGGHGDHGGGHAQVAGDQQLLATRPVHQGARDDRAHHIDGAHPGTRQRLRLDASLQGSCKFLNAAFRVRAREQVGE